MSRRERPQTVLVERSTGSSFLWFVVGGALGAGLALLFAPQSGELTRRQVGAKLGKLRDAADQALEELQDVLSPDDGAPRPLAPRDADDDEVAAPGTPAPLGAVGREPTERRRRGGTSPRQELELRLAEARARRQRALADEEEEPVA